MKATTKIYVITYEHYCIGDDYQYLESFTTLTRAYKDRAKAIAKLNKRISIEINNDFSTPEYCHCDYKAGIVEIMYKDNIDGRRYRDIYTINETTL